MAPLLVAAGVALLVLVVSLRTRRQIIRRVNDVVHRLDERPQGVEHRGGGRVENALARLERTTDRANERLADLRLDHDRLIAVAGLLGDGLIIANQMGRVVLRNEVAEQFVGARHGDAIVEEAVSQVLAHALRGEEDVKDVTVFGPPSRALQVRGVPLLHGGAADGAAVTISDVSSAKRVDALRRDFVANVSHELKTPIGALVALAETLADDDDADIMKRLAVRVLREAHRLARIVDDLLDLSMIEAQEAPEREPVPVELLVEQAVDRVRGAAEGVGVTIDVGALQEGVMVNCDRRQIVSALFNLLDNAVKYSDAADTADGIVGASGPHGGGATVTISGTVDGDRAVIAVRDQGVGIPTRDLERIFERFYRVDRARSRDSGGTGLGLAIVRHVAQAHGGEVLVDSAEGEGSTFALALPLAHSFDVVGAA